MPELTRRKRKPRIKYASVIFKENSRQYTFKTFLDLKAGDKVVVKTINGLGTAEVWDTATPRPSFKCNWILGKIHLPDYEKSFKLQLEIHGFNESDK